MIRWTLFNLLMVALAALAGIGLCAVAHVQVHYLQVLLAAAMSLASFELALLPLFLKRRSTLDAAQSALIGLTAHMLLCGALGLSVASLAHLSQGFMYWLCAFFWVTLAMLSAAAIQAVRRSSAGV